MLLCRERIRIERKGLTRHLIFDQNVFPTSPSFSLLLPTSVVVLPIHPVLIHIIHMIFSFCSVINLPFIPNNLA